MIGEEQIRRLAAIAVPRYTSYPTAADFVAVAPEDHLRWLRRLDTEESVSLYLHVPYCRQLCHYCGCHTKLVRRDEVITGYREALEQEIALVARHLPGRLRVARIAWGGGTPSILGGEGLGSVLACLHRHFDPQPDMEHAIELDPRHVDADLAAQLAALGVNRVSLGVQDLDPEVQKAIGRIQPEETVRAAVVALRGAGLDRINFDLIYGLPRQTTETLRRSCEAVIALDPARIACYGYAHLPGRRANQKLIDASILPDSGQRFEQARLIADLMVMGGYVPIGIDHFARSEDPLAAAARAGRLHRNFQGYTDDDRPILIGFGASAVSRLADGYAQNVADVPDYVRRVRAGRLATQRGCPLDADAQQRATIIEHLMCNFRVDLDSVAPHAGFADELALLRPYVAAGLLTLSGRRLAMTAAGRPFVRLVASVFDAFRQGGGGGFSLAV